MSNGPAAPFSPSQLSAKVLHINATQTYKPLSSSWGWDETVQKGKTDQRFPQGQTLYTLKSPKTCLFCWDFENIWEVFDVDQKIETLPVLLLCVE